MKKMGEQQELFIKKVVFLLEKYLFPKKKILYLVKGFSGAIIFLIYEFFSVFGGVANYKKMLDDGFKQINSSEQLRSQLEKFMDSPMFIASILALIIYSLIVGYLIMSFGHLIVDIFRRKIFNEFDSNKYF